MTVSRKTCGPVQEVKRALGKRNNVLLLDVDEFRTSKLCSHTHKPLSNMKAVSHRRQPDGTTKARHGKIHQVLHCKNSGWHGSCRYGATWKAADGRRAAVGMEEGAPGRADVKGRRLAWGGQRSWFEGAGEGRNAMADVNCCEGVGLVGRGGGAGRGGRYLHVPIWSGLAIIFSRLFNDCTWR